MGLTYYNNIWTRLP